MPDQSNQEYISTIQQSIPFPTEITCHEGLLQIRFQAELMPPEELSRVGIIGDMAGSLKFSIIAPLAIALGAVEVHAVLTDGELITCHLLNYVHFKRESDRKLALLNG
jgi:hypothetical protein